MGRLVAVEGLDGAGKNTLVTGLISELTGRGRSVATLSFPRYGRSVTADLAAEALHGAHGDLRDSVYAMALMFALDRADACDEIGSLLGSHDLVILDRYVASNAAYNAARLGQGATGEVVDWVADLEFGRFGLPVPDLHVLLQVPTELAIRRATDRADADATRARDHYERDSDLQHRVAGVYAELAAANWRSPWIASVGDDIAGLSTDLLPE